MSPSRDIFSVLTFSQPLASFVQPATLSSSEEPDSLPLPVLGTRLEDFDADGNYLASRPGGRFLNSPTGLGLFEKFDLADNLRKWIKTEHSEYQGVRTEEINISAEGRADFFSAMFKDWSSATLSRDGSAASGPGFRSSTKSAS
ncbi:hypothetical protein F52700_3452 [Fusarium sp. NRRL 52700]|nr:hypothetical protein F52700_3452 [Fusarium sp. NRRL 52700]